MTSAVISVIGKKIKEEYTAIISINIIACLAPPSYYDGGGVYFSRGWGRIPHPTSP